MLLGTRESIFIVIESHYSSDDIMEQTFDNRDEAEEYLETSENKAYLICVEAIGMGDHEVTVVPHT